MESVTQLLVPLLLLGVSVFALAKKVPVYPTLITGAKEGLGTALSIAPPLIVLLSAVSMLRASGFLDSFSDFCAPVCNFLGIPAPLLPLMLIRPLSGSAALAIGAEIMATYGVDSAVGLTAAVMLGSTETTFYTVSVYFGACGIKDTRYAVPAAMVADLVGYLMAALSVRLFFSA